MAKQFKLVSDDGTSEIIAYERAALKAYYRAKRALIEAVDDEDSDVEFGTVTLYVRNVDEKTLKGGEWEVHQDFTIPEDDEDLEDLNEDNVDDNDG